MLEMLACVQTETVSELRNKSLKSFIPGVEPEPEPVAAAAGYARPVAVAAEDAVVS